jgi:hypothetical protein
MLRVTLELIRILFIFFILGSFLGSVINLIYKKLGVHINEASGGWFVPIAIIIILYVLYTNWLQFWSFVKGTKERPQKKVSFSLIAGAILLLILAAFI